MSDDYISDTFTSFPYVLHHGIKNVYVKCFTYALKQDECIDKMYVTDPDLRNDCTVALVEGIRYHSQIVSIILM